MGPLVIEWGALVSASLFVLMLSISVIPVFLLRRRKRPQLSVIVEDWETWQPKLADLERVHLGNHAEIGSDGAGFGVLVECRALRRNGQWIELGESDDPDAMTRDAARLAELAGVPFSNDSDGHAVSGEIESDNPVVVAARRRRLMASLVCMAGGVGLMLGAVKVARSSIEVYDSNWAAYVGEVEAFPARREELAAKKRRDHGPAAVSLGDAPLEEDDRSEFRDIMYEAIPPRPPDPEKVSFGVTFLAGCGLLGLFAGAAFLFSRRT